MSRPRIMRYLHVVLVLLVPSAAWGHTLNVFAYAEGTTIHGEAYFRGRVPARDVAVTALDPAGRELGRAKTDEEGKFTLKALRRCDYRLVADAGDGHGGEYTLPASELPDDLPAGDPGASPPAAGTEAAPAPAVEPGTEHSATTEPTVGTAASSAQSTPAAAPDAALAVKLDSVGRQVVELRRQLDDYQKRAGLRDVLGGIGYIVGIAGVAFYFLGVRRKQPQ